MSVVSRKLTRISSGEQGYALVEVLVSAVVLLIAAVGVFTAFTATTRSTAFERNRARANALAEQELERVRSLRIGDLTSLNQTRTLSADGTTYTIHSQSQFLTEPAGTSTCSAGTGSRDFLQVSASVTWPNMAPHPAITAGTVVSAPSGSLVPDSGSLLLTVENADSNGISGVTASGSGPASFSGSTGATGCVQWKNLPEGTYTITLGGAVNGMVDPDGNPPTTITTSVVDQATNTIDKQYDTPGGLAVNFKTEPYGNGTPINSSADGITVNNTNMNVAKTFTSPNQNTITTTRTLFPFANPSSYSVYAGTCASNNPDPTGIGANPLEFGNVVVPRGGTGSLAPGFITLPALHLTVRTGSGVNSGQQGSIVNGADVRITDMNCSPAVTRQYATNASGQLADSATGTTDPGMPYSTNYRVCADANISGTQRRNFVMIGSSIEQVPVTDPTAGAVRTIYLTGTGATSGSGAQCP